MRFLLAHAPAAGLALAMSLALCASATAQDLVAKTEAQTPEQELKSFRLPPGFEIQLVASEPDINKPMNLAFDAKGRLWVTSTIEYPYPAAPGTEPRDSVKVLSDIGPDGRARKVTTFADKLNIPIGLLPLTTNREKGDSALVFAIDKIFKMVDADGDGVAEKRDVFLGTYGFRDTHGMTNHFTVGFDGWVYADHGFSNDSHVKASDGSEIVMNSGNVYRFKPDGSRVEFWTHGQVNPFGLCFDPLGNLYSADCHTRPQYMLLRGAYYDSFGKPHDGLGYGPEMIHHDHGSTGIAGTVYYAAEQFPPDYRDTLFNGNPVTNKVNHDKIEWHGSSPRAVEQPDFLVSDDPWFRPVDLVIGPDGAMYVADFYNRIIGHYEVPLEHPGRDRERGRIWRIVYRGGGANAAPPPKPSDLSAGSIEQNVNRLADPNLAVRMTAANLLAARGAECAEVVAKAVDAAKNPVQKLHALWVLHRVGAVQPQMLAAAARDEDRAVRVHVMRILSETSKLTPQLRKLALDGLKDRDPFVQRAAADALGQHPSFENVRPLLDLRHAVPVEDTHLLHTVRMSIRNQLQLEGVSSKLPQPGWSEADEKAVADVALGVASPDVGAFLVRHLKNFQYDRDTTARYLRQAARYLPADRTDELAALVTEKFAGDLDFQLALYRSVREGLAQRGAAPGKATQAWGAELAGTLLSSTDDSANAWSQRPLTDAPPDSAPTVERPTWALQPRDSADGVRGAPFWGSLPNGENKTGVLASRKFKIPARLSFYSAGHYGPPGTNDPSKNWLRLRAADTGDILAESPPPRNDLAQKTEWDLSAHAGKEGFLEATDGEIREGYAWMAFGRIDPPVVPVPVVDARAAAERLQLAADIAREMRLEKLQDRLEKLLDSDADPQARAAAARALAAISPQAHVKHLGRIAADPNVPPALREQVAVALTELNSDEGRAELLAALTAAPRQLQLALATALAANRDGVEALLKAVGEGKASPRLLQERGVAERIRAAGPSDWEARVAQLLKGVAPLDEQVQQLIEQRRADFAANKGDAARGKAAFIKTCAACHQLDGQGANIGPQLAGLGQRGAERVIEDILDPNRNIDGAFRVTIIQTTDNQTVAGLLRREEGELIVLADSQGKEVSVAKSNVKRRVVQNLSLMPANIADTMTQQEFNDLVAYLLTK